VPEHLEVSKLQESRRLEVHVVGPNFLATFLDRFADILLLAALVVAQTPDEVEKLLLEPG